MAARVMMMAGGTGGHVFPALAVAQVLRERGWQISWLGTPDSFESRVVPEYGFEMDWVNAFRLRGQGVVGKLLAPWRLLRAMWQAWQVIKRRKPQLVVGMGGFVTGPGGLVSRLLMLPLVIHEQNAIPGMTNRWLAKVATKVVEAFENSFSDVTDVNTLGNPVRKEIISIPAPSVRLEGRQGAGHLLIVGGSLGAVALNEILPEAIGLIDNSQRPEIRHQAGRGKSPSATTAYQDVGATAEVTEFLKDMAAAYEWADLVICRAGALTVSELAAAGVPAILVPFPQAVDDHQTWNAKSLVAIGAAILIQQRELTPTLLAEQIEQLITDRPRLLQMAIAARQAARPDAAIAMANLCEEIVGKEVLAG